MKYFADDIEGYLTILNNLYACREGWINFNEVIDFMCSLIKKDREHPDYTIKGITAKGYEDLAIR